MSPSCLAASNTQHNQNNKKGATTDVFVFLEDEEEAMRLFEWRSSSGYDDKMSGCASGVLF